MDSEGSNQCELRAIVGDTNSVDAELLRLYLSTMFADVILRSEWTGRRCVSRRRPG